MGALQVKSDWMICHGSLSFDFDTLSPIRVEQEEFQAEG